MRVPIASFVAAITRISLLPYVRECVCIQLNCVLETYLRLNTTWLPFGLYLALVLALKLRKEMQTREIHAINVLSYLHTIS